MSECRLILGDAETVLPTLESGSVDAVICDPPYPCIKRSYGYWTEAEWFALMKPVVMECRRVLKPKGSAVFVLQPNSERVGRMRTWLWEFMLWIGKEWGIVQDAWWWNTCALPLSGTSGEQGLLRSSLKACVWSGDSDCYRNQNKALWDECKENAARRGSARFGRESRLSIGGLNDGAARAVAGIRGGSTPFNVLPIASKGNQSGHGATTPTDLADWWTRYICPPGGTVLDPFAGTATTGIAALNHGCGYIGIERVPEYIEISEKRLAAARGSLPLFAETP